MKKIIASQLRKPAGFFGKVIGRMLSKNNQFAYQSLDAHLSMSSGMRALEIGYGPGTGLRYFLTKYAIRIDGIDFSELMYRNASKTNARHIREGRANLRFGDFLDEPFEDELYDRVYFANVTYFWKDLHQPFAKISRLLKKNGKLVFYMTDKSFLENNGVTKTDFFHKHDCADVMGILVDHGFTDINRHAISDTNTAFLVVEATKAP